MYMTRDEFLKLQQQRSEQRSASDVSATRVGFFGLKDDGDEAIVRFAYSDPSELEVFSTHAVTVNGKFRKVNCLRTLHDPVDTCPLCAAGQRFQNRLYIKLVEYTRADDGSIVATPKIWERPVSYLNTLTNLFTEYGDISDCVFKVKRSGERGSMQTTYSIMFGNPALYNAQLYKKDFSAFDNYKVLGGPLMNMDFETMAALPEATPSDDQAQQPVTQPRLSTPESVAYSTYQGTPAAGGQRRVSY